MKKNTLIIIFISVIAFGVGVYILQNFDNEPSPNSTLLPRMYQSSSPSPSSSVTPRASVAPTRLPVSSTVGPSPAPQSLSVVNLAVPFTIQAPHQNWADPYGEFCEEASVLMVASYVLGTKIPNPDFADTKLNEIKDFEVLRFGYHKDTTAEETAIILKEFYNIEKVQTVYDPTVLNMKKYLAEGKVIIIPAAGRELGNPNFKPPGPLYHMLVIKGYNVSGDFVTNDPGTRKGADYIYSTEVIMNAIHDWNGGDVYSGRKVIIVVG